MEDKLVINSEFHPLQQRWKCWAHYPDNKDYSSSSYILMGTFSYIEEVIAFMEAIPYKLIDSCMLFWMKDNIFPMYELEENRYGGYFSYKILNQDVVQVWTDMIYYLITENISTNELFRQNIHGLTISPKKHFCIIKIWMKTCEFSKNNYTNPNIKNLFKLGSLFMPFF